MSNRIKIKLNYAFSFHKKGDIIDIEVDEEGTPLNIYWRKRLNDSKLDNCIEVINDKSAPKAIKAKGEGKEEL